MNEKTEKEITKFIEKLYEGTSTLLDTSFIIEVINSIKNKLVISLESRNDYPKLNFKQLKALSKFLDTENISMDHDKYYYIYDNKYVFILYID